MPSGEKDKPVIEDNRDGTVSVRYEPREEGLHELQVKYNGEHVQGFLLFFSFIYFFYFVIVKCVCLLTTFN